MTAYDGVNMETITKAEHEAILIALNEAYATEIKRLRKQHSDEIRELTRDAREAMQEAVFEDRTRAHDQLGY